MEKKNVLEYDETTAKNWEGVFDVCTPQECADIFQKPVKNNGVIYYPKKEQ